jgi:uncharacterized protein with HEPN domain
MTQRDLPYLQHVLDACADIGEFVAPGRAEVAGSKLVLSAVVRQLLVVGEAVKRISPETRALAPNVPWKQIAGMRDRLVHDYFASFLTRCGMPPSTTCRVYAWKLQCS